MDKTTQTHLNTAFDVNIWIDNKGPESDRCLEIAAYPLTLTDRADTGGPVGAIDSVHLVALMRIPLSELAWDEGESGDLNSHIGWTTIGLNADCWSPEDVELLFGPKLTVFVMRVLVDACQNELNGQDLAGDRYRTARTSGRRGLQRCRALAATLKNQAILP